MRCIQEGEKHIRKGNTRTELLSWNAEVENQEGKRESRRVVSHSRKGCRAKPKKKGGDQVTLTDWINKERFHNRVGVGNEFSEK